jgi:hypothetical protein
MKTIIILIGSVSLLSACGLFISSDPDSFSQWVGNSIALVKMDQGYEELSFCVFTSDNSYNSNNRFAWLIPLPASAEYASASYAALEGLTKISGPVYQSSYSALSCSDNPEPADAWGGDYYEVLNNDRLDPTSQDTVYAESLAVISNWLANQGFVLSAAGQDLVRKYIEKGWKNYYVAIYLMGGYQNRVDVKLRFASSEPVIPMEIARANKFIYYNYYYGVDNDPNVTLYAYAVSDHKKANAWAELRYANNLSQKEIDNISVKYPGLGDDLTSGDYITKLAISYTEPTQSIESDVTFTDAADNIEYRQLYDKYSYYYYGSFDPFLVLVAFYFFKRKMNKRDVR